MRVDGDNIYYLDVDELARLGPSCVMRVRSSEARNVSFVTHAIAWCYEDWCAQQRMDDDGMQHSKVYS
jgi:hypothetical protein